MIPKIIHLCWLSGDEYPDSIKKCIDSWHTYLHDYEIWLWDTKRFNINSNIWTKQAFEQKKYAFAADYIRLYALYNYGGIYLDSDVIVYKSFNDLLHLPYFIGEDLIHCFEAAVIGSEPQMPWIKVILDRYKGLNFINSDGSYNLRGLPVVFYDRLSPIYKFEKVKHSYNYNYEDKILKIFPYDFFNSRDYIGRIRTKNSYCSHNYLGSWTNTKKNIWKSILPRPFANILYAIMYRLFWIKQIQDRQIQYSN
jgi:hypothetical protein